jgi:hypothetical protein
VDIQPHVRGSLHHGRFLLSYAALAPPEKAVLIHSCGMTQRGHAKEESAGLAKSGVKMTLLFHPDEAEALRERAFKTRRSQASLVREAVRRFLGIED